MLTVIRDTVLPLVLGRRRARQLRQASRRAVRAHEYLVGDTALSSRGQAATFSDGHVWQDAERFASTRARRAADVRAAALTLDVFLFRAMCVNHIIWVPARGRLPAPQVGASIQEAWPVSLDKARAALDADTTNEPGRRRTRRAS